MHKFKSELNKIDDVYQIKIDVPFQVKFVCSYILKVNGKNVLIDAGFNSPAWRKIFLQEINNIGLNIEDIDVCIITHNHIDHIGLIQEFRQKNPNLKIIMHDITKKILEWETDKSNKEEIEREAIRISIEMKNYGLSEEERLRIVQFFTYWPKLRKYHTPDEIVHDGDKLLNDLEIIWTPGHSFGHICVFDAKRKYIFSGDHILSRITPHIGNFIIPNFLTNEYVDYNFKNVLDQYLQSLDRIDKLNPKIIFPGHQEIIYNPHERINAIKEHHKNRLNDISNVIKNNPLTPRRISEIHFGEDLDEINSYMALSEVLGHLLYLEDLGKIEKFKKNGKFYYKS
ncbi:MAG: MBL fold metallo-hydrolase [Candidatus Lokiarchaeota archaeon]|nr:MBL fold metallo-hydrolase [Candidatus Lokiarchaeota archaeon]